MFDFGLVCFLNAELLFQQSPGVFNLFFTTSRDI